MALNNGHANSSLFWQLIYRFIIIIFLSVDTTPPTVHNCPQSITEIIQLGVPSVPVFWEEPSATDLSQNVTVVSRTYLPGDVFYVGRVMVLYVFSDNSGNQAECSFHVTINTGKDTTCFKLPLKNEIIFNLIQRAESIS